MKNFLILFFCLILSGCSSIRIIETIPFHYSHIYEREPAIDLQEVRNLAILPFKGPGGKSIQDALMEKFFQTGQVRILDSTQLSRIIQERQLKATDSTLQQLGDILDVDLFVTGDIVLSDGITIIAHLRLLDATGHIVFSSTIEGKDISSVIEGAEIIISKTQVPVTVNRQLFVASGDADKQAMTNLIAQQQLQELRQLLQKKLALSTTDADRAYFHYNLAVVYEALNDIDKARTEIEKAIWVRNKPAFTSYREYLDSKMMQQPQITTVFFQDLPANALKIVVLKFQTSDENAWMIASDLTAALAFLEKYNIYGRSEFLEILGEGELSTETISQMMDVDYIIGGILKRPPGIILQTTPTGASVEKAFYEIQFSITDAKTGTIKAIETMSGEYPMRTDLSKERLLYEARIDAIDKFVRGISSIIY